MIEPIEKRKWWFLVMGAVFLFAVSAAQEVAAAQQRTLAFPAFSLASNPASTNVVRNYEGLRWNNTSGEAALIIPRPPDWNGTSDIRIRIFFKPMTNTPGTVQFYVRPRVYDPGNTIQETTGVLSELVSVSDNNQFVQMTINIPAAQFGVKSWWYLLLQRALTTPTYPDEVVILSMAIEYTAISPLSSTFLPSVIKQ
jgi:hypothetical protein